MRPLYAPITCCIWHYIFTKWNALFKNRKKDIADALYIGQKRGWLAGSGSVRTIYL